MDHPSPNDPPTSRAAPAPRKRAKAPSARAKAKAASRRRLIAAAIEVLDAEGEQALTTTRVTRAAGLAQATFYVHFDNIDDLCAAVVAEALDDWGAATVESQRRALDAPRDRDVFRETFAVPLAVLTSQPRLLRIVLQHRFETTSPIGRWGNELYARLRADLVADLVAAGFTDDTEAGARRTGMVADGIIALTLEAALGLTDGRYGDVDEVIDVLVAFSTTGYLALRPDGARPRP